MIGQTISHYKILEKLGGGGMGVVYKAHDTRLDRAVALKFLPSDLTRDSEARERFVHEAKAASALQHPNICTIHDIDETVDNRLFIVMDCYEGESLKSRIANGQSRPERSRGMRIEEALNIVAQVAQGLAKAHESGIVHRDIKPANIMIGKDGTARIVDFGLAKLSGRTLLTKSGTTLGTAAYMSPEQAKGEQVDQRTDIWSLGVVLYEMLTGKRPFESEYEQALIYSILNQEPRPIRDLRPDVTEAIEKICRRAMAKEAKDRYQTASELIDDLESYKAGTQLSQQTKKVLHKERKLAIAGLAALVVMIAIIGIFYSTGKGEVFDHVGVLPFRIFSGEEKQEWLADAMTEEVIARLQEVAALRVPSSRGVMKYKNRLESYSELAGIMHAQALVEASMIVDATGRVRVMAKLIEPSTDRALWSGTFDGTKENILDLQSRIAQAVVREVRVKVSPEERGRLGRSRKVDPRAYELCLRSHQEALQLFSAPSKSRWDSLMANLQKAIAIEPDNAYYYATVVMDYEIGIDNALVSSAQVLQKMRTAAETAMMLDPDLAESHLAAANVESFQCNFQATLSHLARALDLAPGNLLAHLFRGNILTFMGRFEEALVTLQGLRELDPVQFKDIGWVLGQDYFLMRRYDEAISFLQDWLAGNPRAETARQMLTWALSMKGMHVQALAQCDSMQHLGPLTRPLVLANAGKITLAAKAYDQVRSGISLSDKARFYALVKDKNTAFELLESASREPDAIFLSVAVDPFLDNLRDDPRFKGLLKKMNLNAKTN